MKLDHLTKGERFIVEWQYGMLGGFGTALVRCIASADIHNQEKLAEGFPEEVEAYQSFANANGWWETLQEKAEIDSK